MKFIAPIHLRDLISVFAEVERVGRTSMGVRIEVIAHRDLGATEVKVTEGLFTFVALDANIARGRSIRRSDSLSAERAFDQRLIKRRARHPSSPSGRRRRACGADRRGFVASAASSPPAASSRPIAGGSTSNEIARRRRCGAQAPRDRVRLVGRGCGRVRSARRLGPLAVSGRSAALGRSARSGPVVALRAIVRWYARRAAAGRARRTIVALRAVVALRPIIARRRSSCGLPASTWSSSPSSSSIVVAARAALVVEARPAFAEHAEIMVGILQDNIRSGRGRRQAARRAPCSCISRAAGRHCRAGDCPGDCRRLAADVLAPAVPRGRACGRPDDY